MSTYFHLARARSSCSGASYLIAITRTLQCRQLYERRPMPHFVLRPDAQPLVVVMARLFYAVACPPTGGHVALMAQQAMFSTSRLSQSGRALAERQRYSIRDVLRDRAERTAASPHLQVGYRREKGLTDGTAVPPSLSDRGAP
jgi:hypothetical protein